MHQHRNRGFTLVEIAIVAVIIGLLLSAIVGGQALIRSGEAQDILTTAKDISAAVQSFKDRYHYLPGDFPVDQATPEIAGTTAACVIGGAGAGNGNGRISNAESTCASQHLIRAEFVRGDAAAGLVTRFGAMRLIATNDATAQVAGFPASVLNVLELANIPCDVAMDIARKVDAGGLQTGTRMRASVANCVAGTIVPFVAFAL